MTRIKWLLLVFVCFISQSTFAANSLEVLKGAPRDAFTGFITETESVIRLNDPVPAYTQGFELARNGGKAFFLLSSGSFQPEISPTTLRLISLSGETIKKVIRKEIYGEGLTVAGDRVVQITYDNGRALVWSLKNLVEAKAPQVRQVWAYAGEGWGLATDGKHFLMTDGSDRMQLRSLQSFSQLGTLAVRLKGKPEPGLNELEYIGDGLLLANKWSFDKESGNHGKHPYFYLVDLRYGEGAAEIIGKIRLGKDIADYLNGRPLVEGHRKGSKIFVSVFNGIASDNEHLFLTGKYWDRIYKVKVVKSK